MKRKKSIIFCVGFLVLFLAGASLADLRIISDINGYLKESPAEWERDALPIGAAIWNYSGSPTITGADGSYTYQDALYTSPAFVEGGFPAANFSTDQSMAYGLENNRYTSKCTKTIIGPVGTTWSPGAAGDLRIFGCRYQVPSAAPLVANSLILKTGYAKVLDAAGKNLQDGFRGPLGITIVEAHPPLGFGGAAGGDNMIGWVPAKPVGNTVQITWTDINGSAPDIFQIEKTPPIFYDVYMDTNANYTNPANESLRVALNLTGNTVTLGGNGIPGTPAISDARSYFFRMRAKDSVATARRDDIANAANIGHKTNNTDTGPGGIVEVHVNDYTPPNAPTAPANISGAANVGNNFLKVSWTNPGDNDFAGTVVLKKIGGSADNIPSLGGASADNHGPVYTVDQDLGNGWKVYKLFDSSVASFPEDNTVQNGTRYHYAVYAYDVASAGNPTDNHTYQQGRNYSDPAITSGTPGVEPTKVQNFVALTGPLTPTPGLTLNWSNSPETFYGGTIILGTLDVAVLEAITPTSHLAEPVQDKVTPNKTNVFLVGNFPTNPDTAPNNSIIVSQLNGVAIDPDKPYYFKAFSYNAGPDANWDAANLDALNAHLYGPGEIAGDRILPAGGGGVGGIYTYTLKPASSTVLAINSITPPAVENLAATVVLGGSTLPTVVKNASNASQFIGLINEAAGRPVVNVLSKWDPSTGKGVGLTYNLGSNTFTGDDFTLAPGEGYQIFVTDEMTLVLEARRAVQ